MSIPPAPQLRVTRTLSFQLLTIFSIISLIVITLINVLATTFLWRTSLSDLDNDLAISGRNVAQRYLHRLIFPGPDDNTNNEQFSLSDYYIHIHLDSLYNNYIPPEQQQSTPSDADLLYTQLPKPDIVEQYGYPDDINTLAQQLSARPSTITSNTNSKWRALSIPVIDPPSQKTLGHIVIARPLEPTIHHVHTSGSAFFIISLTVAIIGVFAAYFTITHSLRSLKKIENATHKIAAGDLSQRVPKGKPGSEVGMLADSINVMLSHIESSFEVKTRSENKMRQFISDASHELRTPLATVRGYAELYRLGGVPLDQLPQTMSRIESEAKRMGILVEDLLQLARSDEGMPLKLSTFNLTEIANNAISDLLVRDENKRAAKVIGLDGSSAPHITIYADQSKVEQVIANLLTNVLTHTPDETPVDIALGYDEARNSVLEVRDHGPGVSAQEREHIFERFYRTDTSRSRASGGSGLGLSIVASVMQAHNGTVSARETPGGGLTIRLVFPPTP